MFGLPVKVVGSTVSDTGSIITSIPSCLLLRQKLVLDRNLYSGWLLNIAFHLGQIWLESLVAINSESRLTSFPSFLGQPPEVAVLFYSNLSRCPFHRQVVDLDLLLCRSLHRIQFVT